MTKRFAPLFLLSAVLLLSACGSETSTPADEWQHLFNGRDLSNWDKHLGTPISEEYAGLAAAATPEGVFSVARVDGENLIHITGEINGSLATRESFENYHLRLEFRWGDNVYWRRNSGLLYHSFGDFGVALDTWMTNIEFQMWSDNIGDTYLMENTTTEIEVVHNADNDQFIYTPGAEMVQFGRHANGQLIRKSADNENPVGEWNTLDLYTVGRTAVHVVNGQTVMVNRNTGVYENGRINPLTSGKIQIQAEGGELYIRTMKLRPISEIPAEVL